MKLTKNYKILIIIGLAAYLLSTSYVPLQEAIATMDTTFIVKSSGGSAISGARVDCYQHNLIGGVPSNPSFTVYTDPSGIVVRTIAQGVYTVKITAANYDIKTEEINLTSSQEHGSASYTFTLIPGTGGNPPPNSVPVKFWLIDPSLRRVTAYITAGGATYLTDSHGYAVVNLVPGSYSVHFEGGWFQTASNYIHFSFDKTVTVSSATPYTVYVANAEILQEYPPTENTTNPGNGDNWWDPLLANPMAMVLIVVAFVFLLR